jgi:hypothetical protein
MMTQIQRMIADFRPAVFSSSFLSIAAGQRAIRLAKARSKGGLPLFSPYHNTVFALLDVMVCSSVMWCMGNLAMAGDKGKLTDPICYS